MSDLLLVKDQECTKRCDDMKHQHSVAMDTLRKEHAAAMEALRAELSFGLDNKHKQ